MEKKLDHVDYDVLDRAKNAFIAAGRSTVTFASEFGFLPSTTLGASANVFSLNLQPFFENKLNNLAITLVSEGLGTADDARPSDLSSEELIRFWHNIGLKTVAVMTNDVASSGLQPILISLYLPSAEPSIVFSNEFMEGFLGGFVDGCRTVRCVYFSGETPQLKNKFYQDKLDIAGSVFGVTPPGLSPVDSSTLSDGDKIVFIESSGPHENGFTSLRKLAETMKYGYRTKLPSGREFWEAINAPSVLYTPLIQSVLKSGVQLTNIEPISGHGWQKLMRSSKNLRYRISQMLPIPEVFQFVQEASNSTPEQMISIFNYGVGLAMFTKDEVSANKIVDIAGGLKLQAKVVGQVESCSTREVVVEPLDVKLSSSGFALKK